MGRIYLDPRTKIVYASIYIHGLQKLFGKRNVGFNTFPFKDLKFESITDDFDHYFAFFDNKIKRRFIVDFRDKNTLNIKALNWSDVYAKINFNSNTTEYKNLAKDLKEKIIAIGPNFGIKLWPSPCIYPLFLRNYIMARTLLTFPVGPRMYMTGYNWLRRRSTIHEFIPSKSSKDYIFHLSSFYHKNQAFGEETNNMRATFIRAAKKLTGVYFEGGLFSRVTISDCGYEDVITNIPLPHKIYLEKVKKSAFVFNTPAAWGCHGWKLGEYFALGKAIISTPFYNDTPMGIKHGENIHIVSNQDEMYEAVSKLYSDNNYREKLEKGATDYYKNYIEPKIVVQTIINHS